MKLTEKKKSLLREFVEFTCENCGKTELELSVKEGKVIKLHIHRLNRGTNGGEYILRNVKVLCPKCHKLYHANEFRCKT